MMLWVVLAGYVGAYDVVFLSVDTLRADRLGCYGYSLATSENLDRFAGDALVFDDCLCEVPLTSPSFGSMLTSQFPRLTGTTRNGLRMPASAPIVAEQFKDAGYQTICVQSNWTLKADLSGLDRGFEIYQDRFHKKRWGVIKSERGAKEVTNIALELIAGRDPNRPLFAWIHYSDPHAPYKFHREHNPTGKRPRKLNNTDSIRARYDSEVAYTDYHISRLLEVLPKETTAILFVGDHGESLYEHDYLGHGRRIYQTGLHIPFIVRGPGIESGRSEARIRGIDVGPTLLGLAGLSVPPTMLGVDVVHDNVAAARVRVIETYGGAVPRLPGARAAMAGRPPMRQGVVEDGWKLILDGKKAELYHLEDDPMEEQDRAADEPGRVAELKVHIATWDAGTLRQEGEEAELSKDDLQALEDLGYAGDE